MRDKAGAIPALDARNAGPPCDAYFVNGASQSRTTERDCVSVFLTCVLIRNRCPFRSTSYRIRSDVATASRGFAWNSVVGVIADARTESLADATVPQMYLSFYQRTAKDWAIFLRGQLDTAAIPVALRMRSANGVW